MAEGPKNIILCNGACLPKSTKKKGNNIISLFHNEKGENNASIRLPDFVKAINYISPKVRDLLEIASYVFIADRRIPRGRNSDLEFHRWSRKIHFHIRVRDKDFWNSPQTKKLLSEALTFMSGDQEIEFTFESGLKNEQLHLFDTEQFAMDATKPTKVALFSGGLDSFTGAIEYLETTTDQLCLISHQSGQPSTKKTQQTIYEIIKREYPGRTERYQFKCHLQNGRAPEETQRTRSFLYSSVAYALCSAYGINEFTFFENGITSLNFPKRGDMINARSSRTTHPKTIWHLQEFFSHLHEKKFNILHPYLFHTKTDVIAKIKSLNKGAFINSTVSCSRTLSREQGFSHCGCCSQCVDRRFAMHASELQEQDGEGIYSRDFIRETIEDAGDRTTVIDYVRQAIELSRLTEDAFYMKMASELVDIIDYIEGEEESVFNQIYELCKKHGNQILFAIKQIQNNYDNPYLVIQKDSFLDIVSKREYLKPTTQLLVERISEKLSIAIPLAFKSNKPANENDLNDKINALIQGDADDYGREFPSVSFALAKTVPDHSYLKYELLLETKYLRGKTTASSITDGISADIIKYPSQCCILFVLYDPERKIVNDETFISDFKQKRSNIEIKIIR